MKKITLLLLLIFNSINSISQNIFQDKIESIRNEGIKLYKSEMASWYGTDLFIEKYENHENIGGYFSYSENNSNICIFYSNEPIPNVIGTITFNNEFNLENAIIDLNIRKLNNFELELYKLRNKAKEVIENDNELFKHYQNTKFNLIPIIEKNVNKVYLLTGTSVSNVVIFGNDYLIQFDKKMNLLEKKQLHKNIIPIEYSNNEEDTFSSHNHSEETGDFFTPTDICTLMLYGKLTKWKSHLVLSKNFANFWDINEQIYEVITMEEFEKLINEN